MKDLIVFDELRPNDKRAKYARAMIWVVMSVEVIALFSDYLQYMLLKSGANGYEITAEAADVNDTRQQLLAVLYMICFLVSGVTFIMWFRRAYFNLREKVGFTSYSDRWAAGAWFIPVLNWFRPYQIMKEMYDKTVEFLHQRGIEKTGLSTKVLGLWWALWVVNSLLSQIVFRWSQNAQSIESLMDMTTVSMCSHIIGIPLAFLAVRVIKNYSAAEPLLVEIREYSATVEDPAIFQAELAKPIE